MLIVGLTGGVASGKSTVSKVLREEGAYIIDADRIARELVQPHTPSWQELIKIFGDEILQKEGFIDRKKLAALVLGFLPLRDFLQDLRKVVAHENGDDRRRRLVGAQPVIVSRVGAGGPKDVRVGVDRLEHCAQEQ